MTDEPVIFEFERRDCRVVKTERTTDDGTVLVGPEFRGEDYRDEVVTEEELLDLAADLYLELYGNPRRVGYFTLATLIDEGESPDTAVVDVLATAVDEGVADSGFDMPRTLSEIKTELRRRHLADPE